MKKNNKVKFIAEAGINHNGSLKRALKLIDIAAEAGADYVKFQVANSNIISRYAPKAKYQIKSSKNLKETQHDMIKKIELNWDKINLQLKKHCKKKGIKFLTSAFTLEDVLKVKKLNTEIFKIASGEITNFPLLKLIGKINKKTILSTGMSSFREIDNAVKVLRKSGLKNKNLIIMQCTTAYPTPIEELNLNSILEFKKRYKVEAGLSDHSLGTLAPIAAIGLGARYIEKHFTISKKLNGPDHKASLSPFELKKLIKDIRDIEKSLGSNKKPITKSEIINKKIVRRSVHANKNIKIGEKFTFENTALKRPSTGLPSNKWEKLIGKKSKKNYLKDQPIKSL